MAGRVVWSFLKLPALANLDRFGSLPSLMYLAVNSGSIPSRPTKTTLLISSSVLCGLFFARVLKIRRKGQKNTVSMAIIIVMNSTKKEDTNAKPAPGPMYASAFSILFIKNTAVKTDDMINFIRLFMVRNTLYDSTPSFVKPVQRPAKTSQYLRLL